MIELPEACVLADQLKNAVSEREIASVVMDHSPHKFAFYTGNPALYATALKGKRMTSTATYGGMVEIGFQDFRMVFSDGVRLRFHDQNKLGPAKHQMLIEFADGCALSGSVQMYGGLWGFQAGTYENEYRTAALEKPSPLSDAFSLDYFAALIDMDAHQKLSLKAFLATEQRIPGLGNGVLQDILWHARLHPRRKVMTLSQAEKEDLYHVVKTLLHLMTTSGGRDTERDLFDQSGLYRTCMSNLHAAEGCPVCGKEVCKESYMGGSVYYCPECQKLA